MASRKSGIYRSEQLCEQGSEAHIPALDPVCVPAAPDLGAPPSGWMPRARMMDHIRQIDADLAQKSGR